MTEKLSIPLTSAPTPQAGGVMTPQSAAISHYPAELANQQHLHQLLGTVLGRSEEGLLQIQTRLGILALQTNAKLAEGTEILLQFRNQQPPYQVVIHPRQGQTLPQGQTPLPQPAATNTASPSAHATTSLTPHDVLTLGQTVRATVVSLPSQAAPPDRSTTPLPLKIGQSLQVKVSLSGSPQAPLSGSATQATTSPPTAAPSPTTGVSPSPSAGSVTTGGSQTVTLTGTVVGQNNGQPLVQTQAGTLQLSIKAVLPQGSNVTLTLTAQPSVAPPLAEEEAGLLTAARDSRALPTRGSDQLYSLLQSSLGALAQHSQAGALTSTLPKSGPTLTAGILLFFNALGVNRTTQGGGTWPGEDVLSLLRRFGEGELAQSLPSEMAAQVRTLETTQGDWRMFPLPFLHEEALQQAKLFVKDREGDQKDGDGERGKETRFKIEVELTRDGEMQFDGLVKAKRFDLVLRTRRSLPGYMESTISDLFYKANDATGYAGRLRFESSRDWETVEESAIHAAASTHHEQDTLA